MKHILNFTFFLILNLWSHNLQAAPTGDEFLELVAGKSTVLAMKEALDDPSAPPDLVNYRGPEGLTPLMVYVGSHQDNDRQALAGLELLLIAGADLNAVSTSGGTPLGYAVLHKSGPRLVSKLLAAGADPNQPIEAAGGSTALMLAAKLEPDTLVSAALLAAGADPLATLEQDGRSLTMVDLAAQNPNPEVLRLLAAAQDNANPLPGFPLFLRPPADEELHNTIVTLDAQIRSDPDFERWSVWSRYLKWQIDLADKIEARRKAFGLDEIQSWLAEYEFFSAATNPYPLPPLPGRLVVQEGLAAASTDQMTLQNDQIIVTKLPNEAALRAYLPGGRDLWTFRTTNLTAFHAVGSAILAASHFGDGFGEAALLEQKSGALLHRFPALDQAQWAVAPDGKVLAIATPLSLDIVSLDDFSRQSWSWYELLELRPWQDLKALARLEQNNILATYELKLNDEGRFPTGARLFAPALHLEKEDLAKASRTLEQQNFKNLGVLALGYKNLEPNFIYGSACLENCQTSDLDTPLFLVNPRQNRIDLLRIDDEANRALTRGDLAVLPTEGSSARPLISFSPKGNLVAVTASDKSIHFFAARDQGRYLGRLKESLADFNVSPKSYLAAILNEDEAAPIVSFSYQTPQGPANFTGTFDLAQDKKLKDLSPSPGFGTAITTMAISDQGQIILGLASGHLWQINSQGILEVQVPLGLNWTASAWSGDGQSFVVADEKGTLYLQQGDEFLQTIPLAVTDIEHIVLDQKGRLAWVAAAKDQKGRPSLAFVDFSGQQRPIYRPTDGQILSLTYYDEAGYSVAVIEGKDSGGKMEVAPAPTARWAQGRCDLITFDHLRGEKGAKALDGDAFFDSGKKYLGLSPDLNTFFYQEVQSARPYVHLAQESLGLRQAEALETLTPPTYLTASKNRAPGNRLGLWLEEGRKGTPELYHQLGGAFYIYDLVTGQELSHSPRLSQGLTDAAFSPNQKRLLTADSQGALRLWELPLSQPENIFSWHFFADGTWLAVAQNGPMNASDPEVLSRAHWVSLNEPLTTLALSDLRRVYEIPGLAEKILQDTPPSPPKKPWELQTKQAQVRLKDISAAAPGEVNVTVEVSNPQGLSIIAQDLELFLNGQTVAGYPGPLDLTSGPFSTTFTNITLPPNQTETIFSATIHNGDLIRSSPAEALLRR